MSAARKNTGSAKDDCGDFLPDDVERCSSCIRATQHSHYRYPLGSKAGCHPPHAAALCSVQSWAVPQTHFGAPSTLPAPLAAGTGTKLLPPLINAGPAFKLLTF